MKISHTRKDISTSEIAVFWYNAASRLEQQRWACTMARSSTSNIRSALKLDTGNSKTFAKCQRGARGWVDAHCCRESRTAVMMVPALPGVHSHGPVGFLSPSGVQKGTYRKGTQVYVVSTLSGDCDPLCLKRRCVCITTTVSEVGKVHDATTVNTKPTKSLMMKSCTMWC